MLRRSPLLLALLLLAAAPLVGRADDETAAPTLDYAFYKARVAPIVQARCAECHAVDRRREGSHRLRPAPGREVRENDHRRNFRTIARRIEPGNPAGSTWLLKALGPRQGGVAHEGGAPIRFDSLEYGVMVDFINGAVEEEPPFVPPPTPPGAPDFRLFVDRIAPVLLSVCVECHVEKDRGRFRRLQVPQPGTPPSLELHWANYQTVLKLVVPRRPMRSRFLRKPLALADGGVEHGGKDRIFAGDENHRAWLAFINGVAGSALPSERPAGPPSLGAGVLELEAEDAQVGKDLLIETDPGAEGGRLVAPGPRGGSVTFRVNVPHDGPWDVRVRTRGPGKGLVLSVGERRRTTSVRLPAAPDGWALLGKEVWLDGPEPLDDVQGEVTAVDDGVSLRGRHGSPASLLSPALVEHVRVELVVELPSDREGGDDALLLFDMQGAGNGRYAGLTDGGRRFVMGMVESGRFRALFSERVPPASEEGARTIEVEHVDGRVRGLLDGYGVGEMDLDDDAPGTGGRFGALTHGRMTLRRLAAHGDYEVHACRLRRTPALRIEPGEQRIRVRIPAGGPAVDRLVIRPLAE